MKILDHLIFILILVFSHALSSHAQTAGWFVDATLLPIYEGHYEFHEKRILHIQQIDGTLWGEMTGLSKLKLTASDQHEFYFTDIDAKVVFNLNKEGQVTNLSFTRGEETIANKINLEKKQLKKKQLKKYEGQYKVSDETIMTVYIEGGYLFANYNDENLNLIPLRKDLFYSPSSVMKIGFNTDFNDEIVSLTLYVGQAVEFQKI